MTPGQIQRLLIAISQIDALGRELWDTREATDQRIRCVLNKSLIDLHRAVSLFNGTVHDDLDGPNS